jgi:hypothetical protein
MKFGFKLVCKVCKKVIASDENPVEHLQKHAEEELLNYFDIIPTASLKK